MVDRMTNRIGYELSISGRNDGTIEAVYVRLSDRKVARSKELIEGQLVADYDRKGELVGIEILAPVRIQNLTRLIAGPATPSVQAVHRGFYSAGFRRRLMQDRNGRGYFTRAW